MDTIIHSGFVGYILRGRAQRYGDFLAQGDSGFTPDDEQQGQYDTRTPGLVEGERIVFDVAQDQFGNLYATNITPE